MSTFYRGTAPDKTFQVVLQRGTRMYHDQTTRPLNDLRWEAMTLLAHGAQVTVVDKTPYSGVIDPLAYGRIAQVFSEAQAKRTEFGQKVLEEAGLFFSVRSRDWFARKTKSAISSLSWAHTRRWFMTGPGGDVLRREPDAGTAPRFSGHHSSKRSDLG
jgi:hypothetical protein